METLSEVPGVPRTLAGETAAGSPVDSRDVLVTLARVIGILRDREEDFRQAAEHTRDTILQNELTRYSRQRALFVRELQDFEREFGREDVDDSGTMGGALHRVWAGLQNSVLTRNERDVLKDMARGEEVAAEAYDEVLATETWLPNSVKACLSRQGMEIRKGHEELTRRVTPGPG